MSIAVARAAMTRLRPIHAELVTLLRGLDDAQWTAPTICGDWRVRDVAAHLLDTMLRRLSIARDGHRPPVPTGAFDSFAATTAWLDGLNHEWVGAAQRLSTTVIVDLLTPSGEACADWLMSRPPEADADFPVGWAGEATSRHWMDAGREYTEWWLHQQHIRLAVGAPLLESAEWMGPVLALFAHALPRTMGETPAAAGTRVRVVLTGEGGGWCELQRSAETWRLEVVEIGGSSGAATEAAAATLTLAATDAWRLWSKSLRGRAPADVAHITGDAALAAPLLHAKAIMG